MEIQLTPSFVLTDERAECRLYHIPVLVNRVNDAVYGPSDMVDGYYQVQPAANLVYRLGKRLQGEEREAAAKFLHEWPEGPQLS